MLDQCAKDEVHTLSALKLADKAHNEDLGVLFQEGLRLALQLPRLRLTQKHNLAVSMDLTAEPLQQQLVGLWAALNLLKQFCCEVVEAKQVCRRCLLGRLD